MMTPRYDVWINFLSERDAVIVQMFLIAVLLAGNWLLFSRYPKIQPWLLYGGVGVYVTFLLIGGGL
jgi:hypothetical protein